MKRNIIETVLGAIVLLVAGAFLLYSSSATDVGEVSGYTVIAKFNEVGWLKKGDDVRIGGVKIGTVDSVTLDSKTYRADVSMSIEDNVKIPADTSARVSSEGLMGGAYVALDVGGDDDMIDRGGSIIYTQDAQNLEQLLGKFIFSMDSGKKDGDEAKASDTTPTKDSGAAATLPQM
jgi:phospholipid/cholesterol/gamma-HCH transport system substrate-binding protein